MRSNEVGHIARFFYFGALKMRQGEIARIIDAVSAIAIPLLSDEGMELVDIQYRQEQAGWVLRLLIDKEQGVMLDDCVNISRELSDLLEINDPIPHAYHLEISSPGLDRPLKRERDFMRFKGSKVKIKTAVPIGGRRHFVGMLSDFVDGTVYVTVDDEQYAIALADVASANIEWKP